MEVWKDIKGFEGFYQVSNLGRVRSLDRLVNGRGKKGFQRLKGQIMKLQQRKAGHLDVLIKKNGEEKRCWVHRLVAAAFIPNVENLPIVNHIDSNPQNNHVSNLEWCTHKYNINHCVKEGRFNPRIGETSPWNKLKTEEVIEIRERFSAGGITKASLSREYGVSAGTIANIINRKKWKHI